MAGTYITNELGDVYQVDIDGVRSPVDPSSWGWVKEGGVHDHADMRRSIDSLRGDARLRRRGAAGREVRARTEASWRDMGAVQGRVCSPGGGAIQGRTRNARLPQPAQRGRRPRRVAPAGRPRSVPDAHPRLRRRPPAPRHLHTATATASGFGTVYVLEDGSGVKIGYTNGPVAKRIGGLQTGNSRRITIIAEMSDATPALEALIHSKLDEWNVTGEWFARDQLVAQAAAAEGFGPWLRRLAGDDEWPVTVHPPYR
jgi:Meiotically up-regulated gene 113